MSGIGWAVVNATALLLEPAEQEAVLGDLEEAGGSFVRNWLDVVGLLARRQLNLWKSWRPWLAAFGLAMPCSFLLMGYSLSVSKMFLLLRGWPAGLAGDAGVTQVIGGFLTRLLLLSIVAWCGGYLVGSLSRKTLGASAVACVLPCFYCLSRFGVQEESKYCLLLYVVPALWGVWCGFRRRRIGRKWALTLATVVTLLTVPYQRGFGILVLVALWTVWLLVAKTWREPVTA